MVTEPRTVMIYGDSGSTKTTQIYHMARYILERNPGKKIRLIQSDPGGYAPFIDSGMVERGSVEIFDFTSRKHALADYRMLSEGYWPLWVKDNKLYPKEIEGSSEYFTSQDVCKTTPEEWKGIAGYLFDGISSTGEVLKNHCSDQETGVGFKESWRYEEDGYTILGLQEGHYAIIQKEIHARVTKGFRKLPVEWLIYTALVGAGEDKQKRTKVFGPQIVGNASTASAPTWFMDCFHLSEETYDNVPTPLTPNANGDKVTKRVAWFKEHLDKETEKPYLCKPRCAPEMYPKLLEYFPYGFVPLGYKNGIDVYFRVMEKLRKEFVYG